MPPSASPPPPGQLRASISARACRPRVYYTCIDAGHAGLCITRKSRSVEGPVFSQSIRPWVYGGQFRASLPALRTHRQAGKPGQRGTSVTEGRRWVIGMPAWCADKPFLVTEPLMCAQQQAGGHTSQSHMDGPWRVRAQPRGRRHRWVGAGDLLSAALEAIVDSVVRHALQAQAPPQLTAALHRCVFF